MSRSCQKSRRWTPFETLDSATTVLFGVTRLREAGCSVVAVRALVGRQSHRRSGTDRRSLLAQVGAPVGREAAALEQVRARVGAVAATRARGHNAGGMIAAAGW